MAEQATHNRLVGGSNPSGRTIFERSHMENKDVQLELVIVALEKLASAMTWVQPNDSASMESYLKEAWNAIDALKTSKEKYMYENNEPSFVGWLDLSGVADVLEKVGSLPSKKFIPPLYCEDCRYYMNSREQNSKCVCGWGDPHGYCKWGVRRG